MSEKTPKKIEILEDYDNGYLRVLVDGQERTLNKELVEEMQGFAAEEVDNKPAKANKAGNGKPRYIAKFPGLIDVVDNEGDLVFLLKENGELTLKQQVELNGQLYLPPPRDKYPVVIPNYKDVLHAYEDDSADVLFEDIKQYIKEHCYLGDKEGWYVLMTAWSFHNHLLEQADYSGYIYLLGVPERGKSRTMETLAYMAYRGYYTELLSDAQVLRLTTHMDATLFIDVRQFWADAKSAKCSDVFLQRFAKGTKLPRVLYPDKGAFNDTEYYEVFGATAIATNTALDAIAETRTFPLVMPSSDRHYPRATREEGLDYANRLTAWRARMIDQKLPDVPDLSCKRLNDISKPIMSIIKLVAPRHAECFKDLVKDLEKERTQARSDTFDGEVLKAVIDLQGLVGNGYLRNKNITEHLNEGKDRRDQATPKMVGAALRRMGFQAKRTNDGFCISYDTAHINKLGIEYGYIEGATNINNEGPVECTLSSPHSQPDSKDASCNEHSVHDEHSQPPTEGKNKRPAKNTADGVTKSKKSRKGQQAPMFNFDPAGNVSHMWSQKDQAGAERY